MREKYYFSDYERIKELHNEMDKLLDDFIEYPVKYESFDIMYNSLRELFHQYDLDEFQYKIVKNFGVFELEPIRSIDRYILIAILYL